jgi:negative regulator of flagellin synthesis FlgM
MEINRHTKPGYSVQVDHASTEKLQPEAAARTGMDLSSPANAAGSTPISGRPRLEQLQAAMRELPDVDLDRVAAIKLALQRGEIVTDSAALASSMVTYHRGSEG